MELTREQLVSMAAALGLSIPLADLENVRLRLSALLTAMEGIEQELGLEMDRTEPVPPVYPHESC